MSAEGVWRIIGFVGIVLNVALAAFVAYETRELWWPLLIGWLRSDGRH